MDRDKLLYTCIVSLYNISNDLKEENLFISNLILFAADQLMKYRDGVFSKDCGCGQPYGGGEIHHSGCKCKEKVELTDEEKVIEKEVIALVDEVREEIEDGNKV